VLNERLKLHDVAVAADEFILVTAAVRYGFVKSIVAKTLQAHAAAVKRQHSKHSTGHKRRPADEPASSADTVEPPVKQQRVGFAAAVSYDGPAGAAVRRAAGQGLSISDDGSGRDSTSGDRGSSAGTTTATAIAPKQRNSRNS
jgi:hypothetical protein